MKKHAVLITALGFVLLGVAALFSLRVPHVSGPVRHEVYVWQRAWNQPVRDAVLQRGTNFSELVPLKAEISWKDRKPQLTRVSVDYATLAKAGCPIGMALRIGPYPGPFLPPDDGARRATRPNSPSTNGSSVTTFICDAAASIVAEAQSNRVTLSELQIDFDCAESKLDGYRIWIDAIQKRVAPLPVTITALPSWLDARAFKRLVSVATNYVLQVHSVERPKGFSAPFSLCDPGAARSWVETAGRIGVPFRVALPTYGYTLAFDPSDKFMGLSAEGPRPNWPTNAQIRQVYSDPIELAGLVRDWTQSRPAAMRGVIWYRLPTIVDNFNWRWPTLGAIVASRSLQEKLRIEPRRVEAGLVNIILVNEGELDFSSRLAVEVRWSTARLTASDALRDFELADSSTSVARFQTKTQGFRLPAGDRVTLGWLRFDHDCEVRCELRKL